uniref:Uncharacterized protein n=1 Tax=Candidatus Kentrum sp. DK TaxID=2126562 RepID=A0A450T3K0_9GAMM|nr:MAG: hypothetical protein BECKDK2373B_GA0170837_109619 [Candidatus Kentron sp. DK]
MGCVSELSEEEITNTSSIGSKAFSECLLSTIKEEVNTGCYFATTRKIYHSLILARWYKIAIKESLLNEVYSNKGRIAGLEEESAFSEEIYEQYVEAMEKGVFDFIREDIDPNLGEMIPRKYFSGGILASAIKERLTVIQPQQGMNTSSILDNINKCYLVNVRFNTDDRASCRVDAGGGGSESVAGIDFTKNKVDVCKYGIEFTYSFDSELREKLFSRGFKGLIAQVENITPFKSIEEILE